jgi:NADH-quinone oxidoreductase subunit N
MTWSDAAAIAPMLWLVVGGCALLLIDAFFPRPTKTHLAVIAALFLGVAAVAVRDRLGQAGATVWSGALASDAFARYFELTFLAIALLSVALGAVYFRREQEEVAEFFPLVLFATVGMMLMASATDMITLFLGLELMSIAVYVLAASQRHSLHSNEAGFKYLLLGAFSSAFLLYGMSMLYGAFGTTSLIELAQRVREAGSAQLPALFWLGWGLLLVGLGFKIAMVPFHMWTPDVYDGAPAPVTAFMAAGVKAAAFAALLRVAWTGLPAMGQGWYTLLAAFTVVTMTFGNLVALAQTNLKRMLAYSAIAHAGYLLIGVLSVSGDAADPATRGVLFYLTVYALMNLGAFAVITLVGRKGEERVQLSGFAGLGRRHPMAAAALTVCMLSLAGIPPTAGFWGKFYVFEAAVRSGHVLLAVLGVLNSAVAAYYYLRVVVFLFMREPGEDAYQGNDVQVRVVLTASAVLLLWLGLFPGPVAELARRGAEALAASF